MEINKVKSYISFSIRSGKIIFGVDKLLECKKLPLYVIICSTQNDKVTNKIIRFCRDNDIKYCKLQDLILSDIIGRDNCKVIGLTDPSLAGAVMNEFQMGNEIK